ncbi:hypothetical protein ACTQ56_12600 [[Clostridium] aminophilum]
MIKDEGSDTMIKVAFYDAKEYDKVLLSIMESSMIYSSDFLKPS